MNLIASLRVALRALLANKLRSGLTMLGIVIGVAAVIALMGAGAGAQAQITERFESLGSNLLVISPGIMRFQGRAFQRTATIPNLTMKDVEAIERLASAVAAISPEYAVGNATVAYGNKNTQSQIVGAVPAALGVSKWEVEQGRFINDLDLINQAKVAVLGASVVEELFNETLVNPVGQTVKINRQNYQVVGVLKSKGSAGGFANQDDRVFIPLTTAQVRFGGAGNTRVTAINVMAVSQDKMDYAQAELAAILRASHGLTASQSDDFFIQNQAQIVGTLEETTQTFTVLLSSIAAISLLVGGIGVMNIMMVSVTERTREIGIRKAVGAKRRDVMAQFLVEAMLLCLLGGFIGVLVGYGGAQVVTPLLGGTRALVTASSVMMALAVSIGVGLFFGLYPANRAARLHPIEALRYE